METTRDVRRRVELVPSGVPLWVYQSTAPLLSYGNAEASTGGDKPNRGAGALPTPEPTLRAVVIPDWYGRPPAER